MACDRGRIGRGRIHAAARNLFTESAMADTAGDSSSSATATASGTWKTQAFEGSVESAPCYTAVR